MNYTYDYYYLSWARTPLKYNSKPGENGENAEL